MVDPIGPLLTNWFAAISGGQNAIVTAIQDNMELPATTAALLFFVFQGMEWAKGSPEPLTNLVPNLLRVLTILWLTSNIADYDYYVHQMFYVGLPAKLVQVAASAGGTLAVGDLADVTATAGVFSQLWNQMWIAIGMAWAHAGVTELVGVFLAGLVTAAMAGLGLVVLGLIFLCSHILLAVMDDITPFILVFAMFKTTMPIFERAAGKAFALILLQFVGVIVLQIILSADQAFMQQIVASASGQNPLLAGLTALNNFFSLPFGPAGTPADNTMATDMQALISIIVMFIAGAFAMLSVSAIAYSIGTGISVSATSMVLGSLAAGRVINEVREIVASAALGAPASATQPNYSLHMAGGNASLPPPPAPPSIASSTRPSGQFRPT